MQAIWNGTVIAESDDTVVVEGNHYFPASSLKREYVATDPPYFEGEYVSGDTVLPADAPFAVDACKELAFEYQPGGGAQ